ncbi:hypothetical protein SAMN05216480_107100 [Pustulibacterium marinum]|uniref:DUF5683 domain-containing protein n=1 Tax=Pustulibacterium marinum TaxID=1224947 RepID=A0A1I7H5V2_9FLAO|nr:DUF5683 domain-containing protein [Pustulibacterium marinum]SFU56083.1 hypothetical protein SAMN05216480_107100 [Pustulibacterium marinum]
MISKHFACIFFILLTFSGFAQDKDKTPADTAAVKSIDTIIQSKRPFEPLAPSKASFYSAILPGLGQAYNHSYWKIPIVYGGMGVAGYAYLWNNKQYHKFRDAYKRRLSGHMDDDYYDLNGSGIDPGNPDITTDRLEDIQNSYQSDRDLSLLIFIGIYALNIIDANVDAHLKQFNINKDLSLNPYIEQNNFRSTPDIGLTLNIRL